MSQHFREKKKKKNAARPFAHASSRCLQSPIPFPNDAPPLPSFRLFSVVLHDDGYLSTPASAHRAPGPITPAASVYRYWISPPHLSIAPGMSSTFYRLLFVGAPGVGKGTYSSRAAAALHCSAISSGDLLRREVANGTATGLQVKSLIEKGVFVPDDLITEMMKAHIRALAMDKTNPNGYILDGYPRNVAQATALWSSGAIPIDHVVHLTQPRNVIIKKLSSRRSCANCGFVYNLASIDEGGIKMEPLAPKVEGVCDKCGSTSPLLTRQDDQLEVVMKRQNDYEAVATPMLDFYAAKGILHEFPVLGGTKVYLPKLLDLLRQLT